MSDLEPLILKTGPDWGWSINIHWLGQPFEFSQPVMEIRRDVSPNSALIARLDTTGAADGLIVMLAPGRVGLYLDSAFTSSLSTGRAFWDMFALVAGRLTPLITQGAIEIEPHVTNYAGLR